ncbi:hypothetical protein QFC19_002158 [Naganishia cerealis]|uniref:Uncharacterized protein n=1 Tax=Naganishia cerealis TaxID=610337 RepID=A0ACC2WEY3_9TREE|nr:hypothetical protein QFC19_002158 [Naganishia cerealis]
MHHAQRAATYIEVDVNPTMNPNPNMPVKPTEARVGRENQRYNLETGARMVAGCICMDEAKERIIMILSIKHPDRWILPKGGIELDEGDEFVTTAVRETWEEAGCEGKILRKLPVVYDSRGKNAPTIKGSFDPSKVIPKTEFHFYDMVIDQLSQDWPELHKRQRRWCTYSEAKHELVKANRPELVLALELSAVRHDEEVY